MGERGGRLGMEFPEIIEVGEAGGGDIVVVIVVVVWVRGVLLLSFYLGVRLLGERMIS